VYSLLQYTQVIYFSPFSNLVLNPISPPACALIMSSKILQIERMTSSATESCSISTFAISNSRLRLSKFFSFAAFNKTLYPCGVGGAVVEVHSTTSILRLCLSSLTKDSSHSRSMIMLPRLRSMFCSSSGVQIARLILQPLMRSYGITSPLLPDNSAASKPACCLGFWTLALLYKSDVLFSFDHLCSV